MVENQKVYESRLEDLKLVCDGYIEDLRKKMPCEKIGKYIEEINEKNSDGKITLYQGICMAGIFIEPQRLSIDPYGLKIVRNGQLVFNKATECITDRFIVAKREGDTCAVSASYCIVSSIDETKLLNDYLLLWLKRTEFARYSRFKSYGTAHEYFVFDELKEVSIPIPDITIQKSIAEILKVLEKRKEINEKLKNQIKDICPVLIQGALKEGREEKTE